MLSKIKMSIFNIAHFFCCTSLAFFTHSWINCWWCTDTFGVTCNTHFFQFRRNIQFFLQFPPFSTPFFVSIGKNMIIGALLSNIFLTKMYKKNLSWENYLFFRQFLWKIHPQFRILMHSSLILNSFLHLLKSHFRIFFHFFESVCSDDSLSISIGSSSLTDFKGSSMKNFYLSRNYIVTKCKSSFFDFWQRRFHWRCCWRRRRSLPSSNNRL